MKKIDYASYKKPTDYAKFEIGDNRIRVISSGAMGFSHGMKTARGWIPLGICVGDNCPHCKAGNDAKRFWRWLVYDFDSEDAKILDAGPMIGNQICEMAKELNDDPQNYDIIVKKTGSGLKTKYEVSKAPDNKGFDEKGLKAKKKYLITKYFAQ